LGHFGASGNRLSNQPPGGYRTFSDILRHLNQLAYSALSPAGLSRAAIAIIRMPAGCPAYYFSNIAKNYVAIHGHGSIK
jgi:hypothetical protein